MTLRSLLRIRFRALARGLPGGLRERIAAAAGLRPTEDAAVTAAMRDVERRLRHAALRHERAWDAVVSRSDWERYRDSRVAALRASLAPPAAARPGLVRLSSSLAVGDVVVENLVYPVRDGMPGVANLYRPTRASHRGPAVVVVHGHHTDGTHPELSELGVRWARAGCVVLVPALSGHGPRRLHPFVPPDSEGRPVFSDRQDYFFRFNLGVQLTLAGRSLLSWMVEDVVRALDVVHDRPEVDRDRVVLVGSVAGGGDVAAVTAALDPRVRGLVCFGFGLAAGPAVPSGGDGAGRTAPSIDAGSWETTRSPVRSAIDGFPPWLVLASIAPRPLLYAHEFSWSAEDDPVWARLRTVYALYSSSDRLAAIHGRGAVTGPAPENTHCVHVGRIHREAIDPVLAGWLDVPIADPTFEPPEIDPRRLRVDIAAPSARRVLAGAAPDRPGPRSADEIRAALARVLGGTAEDPGPPPVERATGDAGRVRVDLDPRLGVGFELRVPPRTSEAPPVVVAFGANGGRALGRSRARAFRGLIGVGCAVALADLTGCGPPRAEAIRGRHGRIQAASVSEWMLGGSLPGRRLADLRRIVDALVARPDVDPRRIVLWGDSDAPTRAPDEDDRARFDAGPFPEIGEPAGGLLAWMAGVLDPRIRAIVARGTLARLQSVLESAFCFLPMDWVVPGLLAACEIDDLGVALAPRPLYVDGAIDGRNRPVEAEALARALERTARAYAERDAERALAIVAGRSSDAEAVRWVVDRAMA